MTKLIRVLLIIHAIVFVAAILSFLMGDQEARIGIFGLGIATGAYMFLLSKSKERDRRRNERTHD